MKICAIICEYNPLHNGHLKHIEETKAKTDCDAILCIMSGNFVQRGEPAILDKFTRAKHAIIAGADVVLELPTIYALSNAEQFAYGAIKIANNIPAITNISFGSECGDLELLSALADVLALEPPVYKKAIEENLKKGCSLKNAKTASLLSYIRSGEFKYDSKFDVADVITAPNNILGIEYIKTLKMFNSKIKPFTVKRQGASYHSSEIEGTFSSATAIRSAIQSGMLNEIVDATPSYVSNIIFQNQKTNSLKLDMLGDIVLYKLRSMTAKQIEELYDVNEGLENRIKTFSNYTTSYNAFLDAIKTKRYTHARLRRIFMYSILGITKKIIAKTKKAEPYAKVLAIREDKRELLSQLVKGKLHIICRNEDYKTLEETANDEAVNVDILATDIYALLNSDPTLRLGGQDKSSGILYVKSQDNNGMTDSGSI